MEENKRKKLVMTLGVLLTIIVCSMYVGKCSKGRQELVVDNHKWNKLLLVLEQIEKNYVDSDCELCKYYPVYIYLSQINYKSIC